MAHILHSVFPEIQPELNPALAEIEKKTGPNNFFRVLAHRQDAMEELFRLHETLMVKPGAIGQRLREMLFLAVSTVNECERCTLYHKRAAKKAGLTDGEINEIATEQNQHFSPHEQTALRYARELTRTASVSGDLRYQLVEAFTAEQCVELSMIVAMANFTNRINNGLGISLE